MFVIHFNFSQNPGRFFLDNQIQTLSFLNIYSYVFFNLLFIFIRSLLHLEGWLTVKFAKKFNLLLQLQTLQKNLIATES